MDAYSVPSDVLDWWWRDVLRNAGTKCLLAWPRLAERGRPWPHEFGRPWPVQNRTSFIHFWDQVPGAVRVLDGLLKSYTGETMDPLSANFSLMAEVTTGSDMAEWDCGPWPASDGYCQPRLTTARNGWRWPGLKTFRLASSKKKVRPLQARLHSASQLHCQ